jgi:MoxR-like ATPase
VIVGHPDVVDGVLTCLFVGGHALLEGVPGLGKTLLVRTLSQALDLKFNRVQFTPDLMPSDIIGTNIISESPDGKRAFSFQPGPIFAQIVLADEINRATPKTQSALLEAMQEHSVTIGGTIHRLVEPFFVMATQNPIEQEGTYPLPEAQVDRFMLKLKIGYPTRAEERQILDTMAKTSGTPTTKPVVDARQILNARNVINDIYVDDKVKDYIVDLVCATRDPEHYKIAVKDFIQLGASPRATINLTLAAKAYAFIKGRGYVTPQDVKSIGMDVLRHRVAITYEAEAEDKTSETIVQKIFDELPVP